MKNFWKGFILLASVLLFIIFIFLTTIKFELLNKSFVFNSFEKHNVYAQIPTLFSDFFQGDLSLSPPERIRYSKFAQNIPSQVIKPLIENDLSQVLDYLNGKSKNFVISFSLPGLGFENASGINWSPSQIPDKTLQEEIKALNGISMVYVPAGIIILVILGMLFLLYGSLTTLEHPLGGKTILLTGGISVAAMGVFTKIYLVLLAGEQIINQTILQRTVGVFFNPLLSDMATTWIVMGIILMMIWFFLHLNTEIILRSKQKSETI